MEIIQKPQSVASIPFLQESQDSLQATLSSEVVGASLSSTEIASFSALGISSLEVTDHTTGASKVHSLAKEVIAIGGDSTNDVVIDNSTLSDFHLQIVRQDNQWVLIYPHLGQQQTLHGLFYESRQIREDEAFRKPLMPGDVFHISDELGTIVTLAYHEGHPVPQTSVPPQIDSTPLQTTGITSECLQNDDVVQNHPQASERHADLAPEEGIYRLTDLNSANHTHVNEISVTSTLPEPDDEICVDPFKSISARTELTQYDKTESIRIDTVCLKKMAHNRTILLNDISLSIPPSSFVAVVGSSGTGKSTLLDALNGLRPAHWGAVFYNGQDYYGHLADFRAQIGYLPQEDIIHRNLTVERALYYAAKLRLPHLTQAQVEQRIDEVLEEVEMTHRRKLLIKNLSGGQRKRISIALELLAHPSVFFLDEPTSGLDPGLDRKIMLLLRKLADKGHTILLATHATNNINICDTICFLAHGGRLVYFGPPEEATTYFQLSDFAEVYNSLEPTDDQPAIPQKAEERFRQSSVYQKYVAEPLEQRLDHVKQSYQRKQNPTPSSKGGKRSKQFRVLCQRYLELLWNDKWNLAILLLQAPITGIILFVILHSLNEAEIFKPPITMVTQGDAKRYLLVMSFATLMFGCVNSAHEIIKEAHIYRRERAVSLGIIPYMFSKIIILSIICLLQCAILLTIMSLEAHFYDGIFLPSVWEIYITLALTSITGVFIGLTISAFVRNNDQAVSFIPLVLLPQLIFSGSLFPLKGIPLQIFGAFFSLRWSMAALGSVQNLPGNGDKVFGTCDSCNTFQHNLHYLLFTWLALIATILVLGMLTAYFLKRKDANG